MSEYLFRNQKWHKNIEVFCRYKYIILKRYYKKENIYLEQEDYKKTNVIKNYENEIIIGDSDNKNLIKFILIYINNIIISIQPYLINILSSLNERLKEKDTYEELLIITNEKYNNKNDIIIKNQTYSKFNILTINNLAVHLSSLLTHRIEFINKTEFENEINLLRCETNMKININNLNNNIFTKLFYIPNYKMYGLRFYYTNLIMGKMSESRYIKNT